VLAHFYFFSPAVQLTTTVIGCDVVCSTAVLTKKRWPSAETSYGWRSPRTDLEQRPHGADFKARALVIDRRRYQFVVRRQVEKLFAIRSA